MCVRPLGYLGLSVEFIFGTGVPQGHDASAEQTRGHRHEPVENKKGKVGSWGGGWLRGLRVPLKGSIRVPLGFI